MKTSVVFGLALLATFAALDAAAQTPFRPGLTNLLSWREAEQAKGFRDIEHLYATRTVRRGAKVHTLPVARRPITPTLVIGAKRMSLDAYMAANRVSGLLAIKDGQIVLERYGLGRRATDRWTSFSVAKSITSTLVGAAIQDGKIKSLDDPISDYVTDLNGSAYERVSIRQMLTMSSGVKWNEDYADPNSDVARAGQTPAEPGRNPIVSYLARLPRVHEPGASFHYNTGETDLVGILVSKATGKGLAQYLSEKIWRPFGMEQDAAWMVDPAGQERGGCCISMTLRDYGRFGQFMLDDGIAAGRRVVPRGWVQTATSPQIRTGAPPEGYGYFWWIQPRGYAAEGIFGQAIYVFPRDRLVVVFNSAWPAADDDIDWIAQAGAAESIRAATAKR